MRPGQTAPECMVDSRQSYLDHGASMRPGQTAPECQAFIIGSAREFVLQ